MTGAPAGRIKTLLVTQRGERHQRAALEAAPPELDITVLRPADHREVAAHLAGVAFLISERNGLIDAATIAAGRDLRLIQRLGAQSWDIDVAAAKSAGIPVCTMPVQSCVMVAEHLVLQSLALLRRLRTLVELTETAGEWGEPRQCDENYFAYNWTKRNNLRSLSGRCVGIIGFGEIGAELARRLRVFGCTVVYNKRTPLPGAVEAEFGLTFAPKDVLARQSDIIICLMPNLPGNRGSIGAPLFEAVRPGTLLVHAGAPGTLDEAALIQALESGQLGGAALDTFAFEPLRPDDPLLRLARDPAANVILTPHVAAGNVSASREERVRDFDNLLAALHGRPLRNQVL